MNNSQNVSKAEWLCAALIDLLPIAILGRLHGVANIILDIIFRAAKNINIHIIDITWFIDITWSTIYIIFFWGAALYLLLKDAFGLSLGKRIMGIKLQKEGNDASMGWCLLRNLILALFYVHCFIPVVNPDTTNFFLGNLFFFYCVAELLCVCFTNRTIGDNICQLQLVKRESYVPTKVNDHTFCIIAIIILCSLTIAIFTPFFPWGDEATLILTNYREFKKLYCLNRIFIPALVKSMVYSFLLFKLIKPKLFRWKSIILVVLMQFSCMALTFVSEKPLEKYIIFLILVVLNVVYSFLLFKLKPETFGRKTIILLILMQFIFMALLTIYTIPLNDYIAYLIIFLIFVTSFVTLRLLFRGDKRFANTMQVVENEDDKVCGPIDTKEKNECVAIVSLLLSLPLIALLMKELIEMNRRYDLYILTFMKIALMIGFSVLLFYLYHKHAAKFADNVLLKRLIIVGAAVVVLHSLISSLFIMF